MDSYQLFAPIRERFQSPGVERGGCPRHGVTPVYVRKFGEHIQTIFPNLTGVESSFDEQQLRAVNTSLLALKAWLTGQEQAASLADRIVDAYLHTTQPYFVAALLLATERMLNDFMTTYPEHRPVIDAIFCVAGAEGFRDLIRLYDARVLEHSLKATAISFPDILAFVNLHERQLRADDGRWEIQRFEVWCPGFDLAKEYHKQCVQAANILISQFYVQFVPDLHEEVQLLPSDLVAHLSSFVRKRA